ncbi:glycosyl hydrolase [Sorangium sp. So ce693]
MIRPRAVERQPIDDRPMHVAPRPSTFLHGTRRHRSPAPRPMRRARQALVCGISPLLGILFSVACVEETLPSAATGSGGTGNIHETSGDRSLEAQAAYMREAVPLLESDPDVFRYAWFSGRTDAIPNVDLLGARGEVTTLGELYVSLPHEEECSS